MKVVPYLTVSKSLVTAPAWNKAGTITLRVGLHTLILTPYMQATVLFGVGACKGLSISSGVKLMKERFDDGFQLALLYWPFVQIGLYTVVPLKFGNLYRDCFNLIWQIFVSFIANK